MKTVKDEWEDLLSNGTFVSTAAVLLMAFVALTTLLAGTVTPNVPQTAPKSRAIDENRMVSYLATAFEFRDDKYYYKYLKYRSLPTLL